MKRMDIEALYRRPTTSRRHPAHPIYPYLLRRMERSIPYAREIVKRLDEAADDEQRPISRILARQILEDDTENLDLFDG